MKPEKLARMVSALQPFVQKGASISEVGEVLVVYGLSGKELRDVLDTLFPKEREL